MRLVLFLLPTPCSQFCNQELNIFPGEKKKIICRPLALASGHFLVLDKLLCTLKQCLQTTNMLLLPCPALWGKWDSGAVGSLFPSSKGCSCLVPCLRVTSHLVDSREKFCNRYCMMTALSIFYFYFYFFFSI